MAETGRLELDIVDVHGLPLTEPVTVTLRHRTFNEQKRAAVAGDLAERGDALLVVDDCFFDRLG